VEANEELMDDDEEDDAKPPKGMSIAQKLIFKNRLVYLSFDIVTGGEHVRTTNLHYNTVSIRCK